MHDANSVGLFSPQLLVYLFVGLTTARIELENENFREFSRLEWLQFIVRAGSIVLLWPLVLFIEKFEEWIKSNNEGNTHDRSS